MEEPPSTAPASGDDPVRGAREHAEGLARALASARATPAGGAAAAAAMAQGLGLLAKTLRLGAARRPSPEHEPRAAELERLVGAAVGALEADCRAFEGVLDARRRGADPDEAWRRAAESSLGAISIATDALVTYAPCAHEVAPALALDRDAGLELVRTAMSIALANARGDLAEIGDGALRERSRARLDAVQRAGNEVLERLGRLPLRAP